MLRIFIVTLTLLLATSAPIQAEYRLVWGDEFDYTGSPDHTKWGFEIGILRNEEEQYYTDRVDNAYVSGGYLTITARNELYEGAEYTSASLLTRDIETFTYGKFEMRAILPTSGGSWPAFWTTGDNYAEVGWPACGEIDIFEFVGTGSLSGDIAAHVHYDVDGSHVSGGDSLYVNNVNEFHVYAIEWEETKIDFSVDGIIYYTFTIGDEEEFKLPHILRLNLALGGTYGGEIDDSVPVREYIIDYVRVYKDIPNSTSAVQTIINSLLLLK